jgi:hypothetical protein
VALTPEGRVKEKVKRLLEKYGAYYFMPVQNGMGKASLDFLVCHQGRFAAIETKAGTKGMTPRQEVTTEEMRAAKAAVFLINERDGWVELAYWLEENE